MIVATIIVIGLISYFNLKWIYKNCSKGQSVILTMLFASVLVICSITASGILIRSPIVILGDLMKSIGLTYPALS